MKKIILRLVMLSSTSLLFTACSCHKDKEKDVQAKVDECIMDEECQKKGKRLIEENQHALGGVDQGTIDKKATEIREKLEAGNNDPESPFFKGPSEDPAKNPEAEMARAPAADPSAGSQVTENPPAAVAEPIDSASVYPAGAGAR